VRRFRRPKHQYHNHKSEVAARHFAYRRGSAYLERYCLLVALGAYLEAEGLRSATSFEAWLDARPELKQVRSAAATLAVAGVSMDVASQIALVCVVGQAYFDQHLCMANGCGFT
jgi:hypothetical protein